ncbi:hypothetical protein [Muricoccus radiodurans]|uniref:hypothetical protein n=1 Tax=Muricoccus radiodurans TaxID=2231721 RepID=UPI003CEE5A55
MADQHTSAIASAITATVEARGRALTIEERHELIRRLRGGDRKPGADGSSPFGSAQHGDYRALDPADYGAMILRQAAQFSGR